MALAPPATLFPQLLREPESLGLRCHVCDRRSALPCSSMSSLEEPARADVSLAERDAGRRQTADGTQTRYLLARHSADYRRLSR